MANATCWHNVQADVLGTWLDPPHSISFLCPALSMGRASGSLVFWLLAGLVNWGHLLEIRDEREVASFLLDSSLRARSCLHLNPTAFYPSVTGHPALVTTPILYLLSSVARVIAHCFQIQDADSLFVVSLYVAHSLAKWGLLCFLY